MKGYMYILECANGQYYVGSTINMGKRFLTHQQGLGANFTRKNLPIKLVYLEEYPRISNAFQREKQVQGWSRKKKEALILGFDHALHELSSCKNESHFSRKEVVVSTPLNDQQDSTNQPGH